MSRQVLFFLFILTFALLQIIYGCAAQDRRQESQSSQPKEQWRGRGAPSNELLEKRLQEEREKAEAERIDEGEAEKTKDIGLIMDRAAMLINEMKFDDAHQHLDENWRSIENAADEGMAREDAQVREFYGKWREALLKTRQILADKDLAQEEKKKKAMGALVESARARQAARLRELFEQ